MFRSFLLTISRRMSKLTPSAYPVLFQEFSEKPQLATLGEYFVPSNLLELFNLVRETKMEDKNKI